MIAAIGATVLAVPAPTVPAPAVPAEPAPSAAAPFVPCPAVKLPAGARPARPSPPPLDARQREVGGQRLATAGLAIPAGAPTPPGAKLSATSWLVADLDSGAVLGACGAHEYGTPASVQKLLLAAAVLPKLDPDQVVEVKRSDLNFEPGSSAVGLVAGGRYPVRTLWLGLLLVSGNDAANVLARLGGGPAGMPGGVEAMNAEAHRLGAYQTHAVTPSGLDGAGQFTSAYDLALIARACFAQADFRRYVSTRQAQIPAQPPNVKGFQIQNDNQLLYRYPGAMGGKVGYTDLARHTYVGAAERNGRRLVATLLGAEIQPARGWEQATALLDWGFALPGDAAVGRLIEPGESASPSATASATGVAPVAAPEPGAPRRGSSSTRGTGLAVAAAVLLVLLAVIGRRRMRARTAAGGRPGGGVWSARRDGAADRRPGGPADPDRNRDPD